MYIYVDLKIPFGPNTNTAQSGLQRVRYLEGGDMLKVPGMAVHI